MISRRDFVQKNLRETLADVTDKANLLAVSKTWPAEDVGLAYEAGQRDFGENKVQELKQKAEVLHPFSPGIRWHFIGHLQTNKISMLLKTPNLVSIHSIDRLKLLNKLLSKNISTRIGLFLQYNTSKEEEKAGFESWEELLEAAKILEGEEHFYLQGLMTIGSIRTTDFEESARKNFEELRSLRDELEANTKHSHLQLSMGMSQDFPIALKLGSDWVRIGSRIFGSRRP